MLHEEVDSCSSFSTGKALAYLLRWRHHERRGGIVVEGAQALIVHASLSQGHELSHHVDYVRGVHDFIYRRSIYHNADKGTNKRGEIQILFGFSRAKVPSGNAQSYE